MNTFSFDHLKNKVCAITGGGGVIGNAIAECLSAVGIKVAVLDLVKEFADKTARALTEKYGTAAIGVEANVLDKESLNKAKEEINKSFGKIDILINCAGGNSPQATTQVEFMEKENLSELEKTFYGLNIDGFRKVFDLNFMGTLLPTIILTKDMIENNGGVVLNVSSMNSFRPLTKIPAYSAAKASINNFTEWLAVHLAKMNIRVNAIAPGFFLTNQNRFFLIDEKTGSLTSRGNKIIAATPMGKFGEAEDLQGTVLYLLSDLSKFVTGVVIPIDGGFNVYSGV